MRKNPSEDLTDDDEDPTEGFLFFIYSYFLYSLFESL